MFASSTAIVAAIVDRPDYLKGDLVKLRSAGPDGVFETDDDIVNR